LKKIVFLTGTRADFGKLKSLIEITSVSPNYKVHIFATGMHLSEKYGFTVDEIIKCGYSDIFKFSNQSDDEAMDHTLAKTITGFSDYIKTIGPDLIVIHGDRVEALAGAIVGALNNVLVAHIEGGEVSGTVDELIRHAVSKLSQTHFVSNERARTRLIQMGEEPESIFIIGSPDIDVMLSKNLPSIEEVKKYYEISFKNYAVLLFHPVTSEIDYLAEHATELVSAVLESGDNYVVIYPNNDSGSGIILNQFERFKNITRIKIFPSIRFEKFLVLLKKADYILGNSSAGIREAPYYGLPAINIGTRQNNRAVNTDMLVHSDHSKVNIIRAIREAKKLKRIPAPASFGFGNSDQLFMEVIKSPGFWSVSKQKLFKDIASMGFAKV
jgi:UDP-N-acetylglucosamine 2-epimerase (hydrolysing)